MKVEITPNDIKEIAKTTSQVLATYIKSAREYPIPAESLEGIIEHGLIGFIEGRKEREIAFLSAPYEDQQPMDSVYGC